MKANFAVADSPSSGQVQAAVAVIPEGHAYTRNRIQCLEAADGLAGRADIPQSQLAVTHLGETGGRDSVALSQPDGTAVLGPRMPGRFVRRPFLAHIPYPEFLVTRGGDQQRTVATP